MVAVGAFGLVEKPEAAAAFLDQPVRSEVAAAGLGVAYLVVVAAAQLAGPEIQEAHLVPGKWLAAVLAEAAVAEPGLESDSVQLAFAASH